MLAHIALNCTRLAAFAVVLGVSNAVTAEEPPLPTDPLSQLSPLLAQALAPFLAQWIVSSRDAAIAAGVQPIPSAVRAALRGYVPEQILDRVRWRDGSAGDLSMSQTVIRFGDVPAMTLDNIVVFQGGQNGHADPKLWAHELKHVMQFAAWGVPGFAARYVQDYEAVESEAAEFRWQFMKEAGLIPSPDLGPAE